MNIPRPTLSLELPYLVLNSCSTMCQLLYAARSACGWSLFHEIQARAMERWRQKYNADESAERLLAEILHSMAYHHEDRPLYFAISPFQSRDDLPQVAERCVDIIAELLEDMLSGRDPVLHPNTYLVTESGDYFAIKPGFDLSELGDRMRNFIASRTAVAALREQYERRITALIDSLRSDTLPLLPLGGYTGRDCVVYLNDQGHAVADIPITIAPRYSVKYDRKFKARPEHLFTINAILRVLMGRDSENGNAYFIRELTVHRKNGRDLITPHISSSGYCLGTMTLPEIRSIADIASLRSRVAALLTVVNASSPLYTRFGSPANNRKWLPFLEPEYNGFIEVEEFGWGEWINEWSTTEEESQDDNGAWDNDDMEEGGDEFAIWGDDVDE